MKSEIVEIASAISEAALDSILDDGFLKEIPVIGSLINLAKLRDSVSNRIFSEKISRFLFHLKKIGEKDKLNLIADIGADPTIREKLSEVLILSLDSLDDLDKTMYLACIFSSYVEGRIDLTFLRRLVHGVNVGFSSDLSDFVTFIQKQTKKSCYLPMEFRALQSSGFVFSTGAIRSGQGPVPWPTDLGIAFSEVISEYQKRMSSR